MALSISKPKEVSLQKEDEDDFEWLDNALTAQIDTVEMFAVKVRGHRLDRILTALFEAEDDADEYESFDDGSEVYKAADWIVGAASGGGFHRHELEGASTLLLFSDSSLAYAFAARLWDGDGEPETATSAS